MRVVHCKREAHDVYIGRPSRWGNPFTHDQRVAAKNSDMILVESREAAIERYEIYMRNALVNGLRSLDEIAGKTLGCWCSPKACHGDVLIKLCREAGLIE